MSSSAESIFELILSEKLQLVEDLRDDIASTPEAVPVHDWQKKELARRKQNQLAIQAPHFPGKKFSAEFAVDMAVELTLAPEVEWDILEAYAWYEGRRPGLVLDLR